MNVNIETEFFWIRAQPSSTIFPDVKLVTSIDEEHPLTYSSRRSAPDLLFNLESLVRKRKMLEHFAHQRWMCTGDVSSL
jgi:hypothetical protein